MLKLEKQLKTGYLPYWKENVLGPVLTHQYCLNNDQMHSWMDKAKCEKLISELKEERLVENGRP